MASAFERNNFASAFRLIEKKAEAHIKEVADGMVKTAKAHCPVSDNNEPGHVHTRDTIRAEQDEHGDWQVLADGAALWINYGTRYTAPRPFFSQATETARRDLNKPKRFIR